MSRFKATINGVDMKDSMAAETCCQKTISGLCGLIWGLGLAAAGALMILQMRNAKNIDNGLCDDSMTLDPFNPCEISSDNVYDTMFLAGPWDANEKTV